MSKLSYEDKIEIYQEYKKASIFNLILGEEGEYFHTTED